jgi:hypothetical protein
MAAGALATGVFLGLGACGEKSTNPQPTPGAGEVGTSQDFGKMKSLGADSVLIDETCIGHSGKIKFDLPARASANKERWVVDGGNITDEQWVNGLTISLEEKGIETSADIRTQLLLGLKARKAAVNIQDTGMYRDVAHTPAAKMLGFEDGVVCFYRNELQPNFN